MSSWVRFPKGGGAAPRCRQSHSLALNGRQGEGNLRVSSLLFLELDQVPHEDMQCVVDPLGGLAVQSPEVDHGSERRVELEFIFRSAAIKRQAASIPLLASLFSHGVFGISRKSMFSKRKMSSCLCVPATSFSVKSSMKQVGGWVG